MLYLDLKMKCKLNFQALIFLASLNIFHHDYSQMTPKTALTNVLLHNEKDLLSISIAHSYIMNEF